MPSGTKAALAVVGQDLSHEFNSRYMEVKQQIELVEGANLEAVDRVRHEKFRGSADAIAQEFAAAKNDLEAKLVPQIAPLKQKQLIFAGIGVGAVLLGVILLVAVNPLVGIIIAAIGAGVIAIGNKVIESEASKLAANWRGLFAHYEGQMGEAETYQSPASGFFAEVDALYLKSLTDSARGTILNQRGQAKAMQQQEAMMKQQAEIAAAQAAQMAQMQKQLNAQGRRRR